jgi:predicted  nucleic acid-binding Zn-ribbon protein
MKLSQIDGLESQLGEYKDRASKAEHISAGAFEKQLESFNDQRKELNDKIDHLTKEYSVIDKENTTLKNKEEHLREDIMKKQQLLLEIKEEFSSEKTFMINKLEQQRIK